MSSSSPSSRSASEAGAGAQQDAGGIAVVGEQIAGAVRPCARGSDKPCHAQRLRSSNPQSSSAAARRGARLGVEQHLRHARDRSTPVVLAGSDDPHPGAEMLVPAADRGVGVGHLCEVELRAFLAGHDPMRIRLR